MASLKVTTADFTLSSSWKCKKNAKGEYEFETSPSESTNEVSFDYSLVSGAKITKSQIYASLTSPLSGCSKRNVNGNTFAKYSDSEWYADVTLSGNAGTFTAKFTFKANGNKNDESQHTAKTTFSNVYLWIEYEMEELEEVPSDVPVTQAGFRVPPQSVCIYDQDSGDVYMFDGVTQIQHDLSMKIEEEPDKNKEKYVNNARNEPDKLTIDILMSDVYWGDGPITNARGFTSLERTAFDATKNSLIQRNSGDAWPRSENAFYVLHDLKEARKKLSVITPQYVHTDMIIGSVTVTQDADHQFGWEGQITFQHVYEAKAETKTDNSTGKSTTDVPTSANGWFGGIVSSFASNLKSALGGSN